MFLEFDCDFDKLELNITYYTTLRDSTFLGFTYFYKSAICNFIISNGGIHRSIRQYYKIRILRLFICFLFKTMPKNSSTLVTHIIYFIFLIQQLIYVSITV